MRDRYVPAGGGAREVAAAPAPGRACDAFNGAAATGTWSLYAYDDEDEDTGSIASWELYVDTGRFE